MRTSSSTVEAYLDDRDSDLAVGASERALRPSRPRLGFATLVMLAALSGLLAFFAVNPRTTPSIAPASPDRAATHAEPLRHSPAGAPVQLFSLKVVPERSATTAASARWDMASFRGIRPAAAGAAAPNPGLQAMAAAADVTRNVVPLPPPPPIPEITPLTRAPEPPSVPSDAIAETPKVDAPEPLPTADRPAAARTRRAARRPAAREPDTTGSTIGRVQRRRPVRAPSRAAPEPAAPFSLPGALRPGGS